MRRVTLMLAAVAGMVALFAAVAYAATIDGTREGERILETDQNDTIYGRGGGDSIQAWIFGPTFGDPPDRDVVYGNSGDDSIDLQDGDGRDTANGGNGNDGCTGDQGDVLNCEYTFIE